VIMELDLVVFAAIAFSLIFAVAWAVSPALRQWVEKPKYQFQKNVEGYEESIHK
jgi:hypothetical protein